MAYKCGTCGWEGEVIGRQRCMACNRNRTRQWRKDNPDKRKAQKARWLSRRIMRQPDYLVKRRREKAARNPATVRAAWQRRIEWLAQGTATQKDLHDAYALSNGRCVYCGRRVKCRFNHKDPRGFDHIVPRIKGGKHERGNIVVACRRCNEIKSGE